LVSLATLGAGQVTGIWRVGINTEKTDKIQEKTETI